MYLLGFGIRENNLIHSPRMIIYLFSGKKYVEQCYGLKKYIKKTYSIDIIGIRNEGLI